MTDLRKAAEMALEWMNKEVKYQFATGGWSKVNEMNKIMRELRQALAQEQTKCPRCGEVNPAEIHTCSPQVAQEPVAWQEMVVANLVRLGVVKHKAKELAYHFYTYDPPPKREWVGLTDEEIDYIFGLAYADDMELLRTIEAKLKDKNG